MLKKILIVLLLIFILGIIFAGFLILKKGNIQNPKTKLVPIPIAPTVIKPGIGVPAAGRGGPGIPPK